MREILFKGKRTFNGEWIEGYLTKDISYHKKEDVGIRTKQIKEKYGVDIYYFYRTYDVIPETVGQYTGLTDKNGKKIFEGDILKVCRGEDIEIGYVSYDERMAAYSVSVTKNDCLVFIDWFIAKQTDSRVWIEVIGNIHDNPELLKGGAE